MADSVYDIVGAFQDMEMDLIKSMQRNMKRHINEQVDEGMDWTQWQAEMLNGLAQYKEENASMLNGYYSTINDEIEQTLKKAYANGASEQEIEILEKIRDGYKSDKVGVGTNSMQGSFFKINEKKLNALIYATVDDFKTAESSILRVVDDAYRQTMFKAQMNYNAGAKSLWKAVDMATKDFLSAGINNVEYKNGARVNIASYAEMALRTSNKRANFMGAADKRSEYGINTVKVTTHNSACPLCIPWQGRAYIDDVYGDGDRADSKKSGYPLLSIAIKGGMFHPNCKNGLSTYYEGINDEPNPPTKEEAKEMARRYDLEQEQRNCERNIRKYKRLSAGSLDADDVAKYTDKQRQWTAKYNQLIKDNSDVLRKDPARLKLYGVAQTNTSVPKTPIRSNKSVTKALQNNKAVNNVKTNGWKNCATISEIEKQAEKYAGYIDMSGIKNVDHANKVFERMDELTTRYPINNLRYIKSNSRLKNANARSCGGTLELKTSYINNGGTATNWKERTKDYNSRIEEYKKVLTNNNLTVKSANSYKNAIKQMEIELKYNRWSVSSESGDFTDTITHEYGHILADQRCGQINGYSFCKNYMDADIRQKCAIIEQAYARAVAGGDIYNISRYASSNKYEFFAETFAMYYKGESLPDYIIKMFKEVL